ncbi:alpha/beta hydrolase [Caulobacter segnis]|uniref:alpha/beta fold hydrolase n=1 Tax=Caulobacter segnis TaxID=88688 RepID=UPI002865B3F8|nr:alpha/beta hydrolase [Caulobacter segnis]MDR6624212.1 pimeloyl-ACP methyl ester carboxylesterase [Caulobacter segnis]
MKLSTPVRAIAIGCALAWATLARAGAGFVAVPDGKLAYETCGAGPTTVVLLHDGILHSVAYDDIWPTLCQRFKVIRYDRRGYGASPPADQPYRPVDDLAVVMKTLEVKHAVLVGSSSGSGLAVDYALAHPEQVDRLVLVGPWISGFDASFGFIFRALKLLTLYKLGLTDSVARDPYILTKSAAPQRERLKAILKAYPGNLTAGTRELPPSSPARPRLGDIHVPTLILVGEVDIKDVQEQAKALEAAIPGARREVVPKTGHLMYLERPKAFAERVTRFIDQ